MRLLSFLLISSVALFSCNQNDSSKTTAASEDGFSAFSADSLGKNISVLSSDEFMGRKPFTEGENRAIGFLQQKFKEVGLEPGNGESYLQDVPMVNIATTADSVMQV